MLEARLLSAPMAAPAVLGRFLRLEEEGEGVWDGMTPPLAALEIQEVQEEVSASTVMPQQPRGR